MKFTNRGRRGRPGWRATWRPPVAVGFGPEDEPSGVNFSGEHV